jgi:hypothetical protein
MRKSSILTTIAAAAATVVLAGGPAVAGNAHFIANATSASVSGSSVIVQFKEAGLESGSTSTIQVSGHIEMLVQCVNGGNKVPSDPKKTTFSGDVVASGEFTAAKNGNLTGSLSLSGPSAASVLSCPGGQTATIMWVDFSNLAIDDLDTGAHLDL